VSNETGYAEALDVVGYNYQEFRYEADHKKYPRRIIYGSENGMMLDFWKAVTDNDYVLGQFLWTGFDYMGEARRFPWRHNTAGTIDMAGNKKTEFYFRQSLWSDRPMVYIGVSVPVKDKRRRNLWAHLFAEPRWNWDSGQVVRISSFSNCDEVELFLNGKSLGRKKKENFPRKVIPWEIPFEPGVLKAVARIDGEEQACFQLETSGPPAKLTAQTDTEKLLAGKQDIAHIMVTIVDECGIPVYLADDKITCEVSGSVRLLGMEDSNPMNIENYKDKEQSAFQGKVLCYIQALEKAGTARVTLTAPDLDGAVVELDVVKGKK
jgi:hypothetical protein